MNEAVSALNHSEDSTDSRPGPPRSLSLAVVIPAYQAANYLQRCLDALEAGGFNISDVVVVDDGSTDGTGAVAETAGARVVRQFPGKGASAARNLGASHIDADIICFVDADVVVHPGTFGTILKRFEENPDLDAVFGSYDDKPGHPGYVSQYRNLLHHYVHQNGAGPAGTFWTGLGAVKRAVFEKLGGFDSSTENIEDVDFGMRVCRDGGQILLDPTILGKHLKHWTIGNMIKVDVFGRAAPWTRLIFFRHGLGSDLNTSSAHRVNLALVALLSTSPIAAVFGLVPWQLILVLLLCFVAVNGKFFLYLLRRAGPLVALTSIPLHALHYACAGFGFSIVFVGEVIPRKLIGRKTASQFELRE